MATKIDLLIVDDHHAVIEGYKSILSYNAFDNYEIEITTASNCESAYKIITNPSKNFDIILLDMILPAFEIQQLHSGADLAILIKKQLPQSKIIMLTSHTESFELYNIINEINPSGLLVKSDFTPDEFIMAFDCIFKGGIYHSITARQSFKEFQNKANYLDAYNRRIISLLSKGIATKNLPNHLNLAMSAIEKRKGQIKIFFDIKKGNDEDIIREAKKRGFI